MRGSVIHRRGLAKKKGGVGRHITKMVPRIFAPNLQTPPYLGAGVEEVCAYSRHGARSQDDKQAGRLQGAEEIGAI